MNTQRKSSRIISDWPMAVIALGIVLTLVWAGLLVWFLLHLLHVV